MNKAPTAAILVLLLSLLLLPNLVSAAEPNSIISNSADWRDVYSVMLYGSLTGRPATFLVSDRHSFLLPSSISARSHLWVVSSTRVPYARGYGNYLEGLGYTVESFDYDNANLELAEQVNTTSFVIVDDSYGYNAISVAPYAVASKSFVLFADENNIDEVDAFLTDRGATKVLVYGHVDRAVKTALVKYDPEIINQDGDRFANNIEILKRYQKISGARQVVLTNGEFIEHEIMSGQEPVIFIGRNNVPDVVRNYITASDINIGVLIGNELVNTATFIRRQLGISVFVKFARSARSPSAAITQVEALDMFYLPSYSLNIELDSITYNKATRQLEVVLRNTKDVAAYFKGSYTITNPDGTQATVGDADVVFIEPNSYKTVTYLADEMNEDATIDIYIIYGESRNSLEFVIDTQYCLSCEKRLSLVDVLDQCSINMSSVSYNLPRQLFYAEVQNLGTVSCYVDVEFLDVIVAAEKVTYHLSDVAFFEPGASKTLKIKGELEEEDLEDNRFVNAKAFYGQRQNSLVKVFSGRFLLQVSTAAFSMLTVASYAVLAVIVALAALLGLKIYKGKMIRKF